MAAAPPLLFALLLGVVACNGPTTPTPGEAPLIHLVTDLSCYSVRGPAYTIAIYGVASDWPPESRELITLLRELQAYVS